jgi:hypothetical protein
MRFGKKNRYHIDLIGQIALGVIIAWTRTVWQQFELLAGKSAPHEFIQLLVYKAATFSDEIEKVDTVRAYHVRSIFLAALVFVSPMINHPQWPMLRVGQTTLLRLTWSCPEIPHCGRHMMSPKHCKTRLKCYRGSIAHLSMWTMKPHTHLLVGSTGLCASAISLAILTKIMCFGIKEHRKNV